MNEVLTCFAVFPEKKNFTEQFNSDDLMNSFHLLLCTVDFIFQDLRRSESARLLDSDFSKFFWQTLVI